MATRYVKQLVHDDGEAFVLWHPTLNVYCPVLCDEDNPPHPKTLNLNLGPGSVIDDLVMETMQWRLTGEAYNSITGEPE